MCDIKRIVCDPGNAKLESIFPGLFYTTISRASTIGLPADRTTSAIFFTNLSRDRIEFLRGKNPNQPYKLIEKRDIWTQHLHNNRKSFDGQSTMDEILIASKTTTYTMEQLDAATNRVK